MCCDRELFPARRVYIITILRCALWLQIMRYCSIKCEALMEFVFSLHGFCHASKFVDIVYVGSVGRCAVGARRLSFAYSKWKLFGLQSIDVCWSSFCCCCMNWKWNNSTKLQNHWAIWLSSSSESWLTVGQHWSIVKNYLLWLSEIRSEKTSCHGRFDSIQSLLTSEFNANN